MKLKWMVLLVLCLVLFPRAQSLTFSRDTIHTNDTLRIENLSGADIAVDTIYFHPTSGPHYFLNVETIIGPVTNHVEWGLRGAYLFTLSDGKPSGSGTYTDHFYRPLPFNFKQVLYKDYDMEVMVMESDQCLPPGEKVSADANRISGFLLIKFDDRVDSIYFESSTPIVWAYPCVDAEIFKVGQSTKVLQDAPRFGVNGARIRDNKKRCVGKANLVFGQ